MGFSAAPQTWSQTSRKTRGPMGVTGGGGGGGGYTPNIPKSRPSHRWKTVAKKWTPLITHCACQIPPFARRHFHYISLNENVNISIQISLNYVTDDPIDNKATLIQIMAQSWTDDKPSPEAIMTKFIAPHVVTLTVASCTRSALHEKTNKQKK